MNLSDGFELLATAPDGVARLRELILSLAVQGKLVAQDSTDERAAMLLQKIRLEKERKIADKVKREKEQSEILEEEMPYELPNGWEWARLADLTAVLNGRAYAKHELLNAGIPVLRVGNLFTSKQWYYSDLELEAEKYCDSGDLLYAWSASFGPFIWDGPKAIYHYHIWKLDLHCETCLSKNFLYTFLLEKTQEIKASGHGIAMLHMTKEKMERIVVPVPPLAEQLRIVAKVDELMRLCDELETRGRLEGERHAQLVATLFNALAASESAHELAENWARVSAHFDLLLDRPEAVDALEQTILQLAVRGLLLPQDPSDEPAKDLLAQIRVRRNSHAGKGKIKHGDPLPEVGNDDNSFDLPDGWQAIRFGEVWEHSFYGPRFSNDDYVSTGGLPTIRTTDMSGDRIILKNAPCVQVPDDKREAYLVKKGDLLVTRSGSIGVMALFDLDLDAIPSAYLIRIRFVQQVVPAYCLLFLNSPNGKEQMGLSTTSVGVPNVNATKMASFVMPLPPRAEQLRIVARVEELRRLCADLRERLNARQTCHARFAETLVDQVALTAPVEENTDDLAAVA
ncbi:type I restriction enzyme S subunit [Paraburkholderia youngii]|uniref:restriction endonuclease subunit S n=1 Tax=Paraburkholderia youngii TaxID=2782701 RepID=UPI003D192196